MRRDLANCQQMHRTLMRAASAEGEGEGRHSVNLLYRIEEPRSGHEALVYVQSAVEPDWSRLPAGYLSDRSATASAACKRVDPQYAQIADGMVLRFALRANPTKKVGSSLKSEREQGRKRSNGRRVFLKHPDDQLAWLDRKARTHGFELLSTELSPQVADVDAAPADRVVGKRAVGKDREVRSHLEFGSALFQGRLRVVDADSFREALAVGIGPGKAYGFGLLTIAPLRT